MKDLEQRDPDEHVGHRDVAVPPERHAHGEERELGGTRALAAQQAVNETAEKHHRDDRRRHDPEIDGERERRRRHDGAASVVIVGRQLRHARGRQQNRGAEPADAHRHVETRRGPGNRAGLGIVDAQEPVGLHQPVPDAPHVRDEHHRGQLAHREQHARAAEDEWRQQEAILEATEQQAIAVRAHHAGQMMSDGAERGDEEIDLLRPEPPLRRPQRRHDQQRRTDDQEKIAKRVDDPRRAARRSIRCRPRAVPFDTLRAGPTGLAVPSAHGVADRVIG